MKGAVRFTLLSVVQVLVFPRTGAHLAPAQGATRASQQSKGVVEKTNSRRANSFPSRATLLLRLWRNLAFHRSIIPLLQGRICPQMLPLLPPARPCEASHKKKR